MRGKKLSGKVKLFFALLFILAAGVFTWQAVLFLIPPSKGEQCQLNTEPGLPAPAPLIPEGQNPTPSSNPPQATPQATPSQARIYNRSGFGLAASAEPLAWSAQLGTGWYVDWDVQPLSRNHEPNHWQTVRLKPGCIYPSEEYIRWAARRYSGNVWVIGNEPDVALQDDLTPEEYAQDYHELYSLIKGADRTAAVAVAGVAQATPLRLEYLDRVLLYYKNNYGGLMPVDWWTLHGYVLQEKRGSWGVGIPPGLPEEQGQLYTTADHGSLAIFISQIVNFRTWMAENGYRDAPLALTEFGILLPESFGYSQYWVSKYLSASVAWLDSATNEQTGFAKDGNRLVQRWAWFSLSDPSFASSNLANLGAGRLTIIGQAYRDFNNSAGQ